MNDQTLFCITEAGLKALQISALLNSLKNKYFATFKGINSREIAVFETEQERNAWVNFQDPFARLDPEYKDFAIPRKSLSATYAITRISQYEDNDVVADECNDNQHWIILHSEKRKIRK